MNKRNEFTFQNKLFNMEKRLEHYVYYVPNVSEDNKTEHIVQFDD